MKNLLARFRPFRRRDDAYPVADVPRCADDIDLERVIWDPKYRETARKVLNREAASRPAEDR